MNHAYKEAKASFGRPVVVLLGIVAAIAAAYGMWNLLSIGLQHYQMFLPEETPITEAVKSFVEILSGLIVVFGTGLLVWRTWVADRQSRTAIRQADLVERGQVTERFKDAIAQLGDDKRAIRLGGIYSLERIAKDSEYDRQPIVEVLCAFVRDWRPKKKKKKKKKKRPALLPTDIAAVLTVLTNAGNELQSFHRDLSGADFAGRDLSGLNLAGLNLQGADLQDAKLVGVNLEDADLRGAILQDAKLQAVERTYADLPYADRQADFQRGEPVIRAKLHGADLRDANLRGADLQQADLQDTKLRRADFQGADLGHAHLQLADLYRAQLKDADLRGADLQGADLWQADLRGADLRRANDLQDACTLISKQQLALACGDETTKLPEGMESPEEAWARKERQKRGGDEQPGEQ